MNGLVTSYNSRIYREIYSKSSMSLLVHENGKLCIFFVWLKHVPALYSLTGFWHKKKFLDPKFINSSSSFRPAHPTNSCIIILKSNQMNYVVTSTDYGVLYSLYGVLRIIYGLGSVLQYIL